MKVLLTGSAGFIGFHVARALLKKGIEVIGLDNLTDYYDVQLKENRLKHLRTNNLFTDLNIDVCDYSGLEKVTNEFKPQIVVHFAAQAGVRYSLVNPEIYVKTNFTGFYNIIEVSKKVGVDKFIYASSSSVYGNDSFPPFKESEIADKPLNLYAATKRSNELLAYSYNHLYGLKVLGLRFFTVYGPWGRPDMALFKFVKNILNDEAIDLFNNGNHSRDFTYIDDIVSGVLLAVLSESNNQLNSNDTSIYNIGKGSPEKLTDFLAVIEDKLGKRANVNFLDKQMGDVDMTFADISKLTREFGYNPKVSIDEGVGHFVDWYLDYYK